VEEKKQSRFLSEKAFVPSSNRHSIKLPFSEEEKKGSFLFVVVAELVAEFAVNRLKSPSSSAFGALLSESSSSHGAISVKLRKIFFPPSSFDRAPPFSLVASFILHVSEGGMSCFAHASTCERRDAFIPPLSP